MTTTDAAPRSINAIIPTALINTVVMRGVEKHLDRYERISCLFLLIENYETGYDDVIKLGISDDVVSKCIQTHGIKAWEAKIFEILCLIQNNEVLYNLGVSPKDAQSMCLSNVTEFPYKVDKVAKAFYQMFESLTKEKISELLNTVYKTPFVPIPDDDEYWIDENSLEMHLLWWIKKRFITINRDKWNLKNLLKILKEINMSNNKYYEILETYNDVNNIDPYFDDQLIINQNVTPGVRGDQTTSRSDGKNLDKFYRIKKGLVVVFNQMIFTGKGNWPERNGSEMDCSTIKKIFENKFGFDYQVFENSGKKKIFEELDNLEETAKNYNCVVVFFLSHGVLDHVIASDGLKCSIREIRAKLCSEALIGIPKVLVIQACQPEEDKTENTRSNLTVDGPRDVDKQREDKTENTRSNLTVDGSRDVDKQRHLFIINSTIPGELAVRDPQNGTWFIQDLCKVLPSMQETEPVFDIDDCVREVNRDFETRKARKAVIDGNWITQACETRSTLSKKLIFPIISRRSHGD